MEKQYQLSFKDLDQLIDKLEALLPENEAAEKQFNSATFWADAKAIQAIFNDGIKYPTKEERELAWLKFNGLRNMASELGDKLRGNLSEGSEKLKNEILAAVEGLGYEPTFEVDYFFDKKNVDAIKAQQSKLRDAQKKLSSLKNEMLGADKQICFDRFQELNASFDEFWKQHHAVWDVRKAELEAIKKERNSKNAAQTAAFKTKLEKNIEKTRDKIRRATLGLKKQQVKLIELEEKVENSDSGQWTGIFEQWRKDCTDKIKDIEQHIQQMEGWIKEDQAKIDSL